MKSSTICARRGAITALSLAAAGAFGTSGCNALLGIHELDDEPDATATPDANAGRGDGGATDAPGATDATTLGDGARGSTVDAGLAGDGTLPSDAQATDGAVTIVSDGGCAAGLVACDGGCSSLASVHSCGACGHDCAALPHVDIASLTCSSGTCGYSCAENYADCPHSGTGCATALSNSPNCGACATTCPTNTACSQADAGSDYACVSTCPGTAPTLCTTGTASQCVNEQTDNANCNGCGSTFACTGKNTCIAGHCTVQIGVVRVSFSATENIAFGGTIANVTDAITSDAASALTAAVDWGDGSSGAGTVTGSGGTFSVSGSHVYATSGTVTVTVTVSDAATGASNSAALAATVAACSANALRCSSSSQLQECSSNGQQWNNLAVCSAGYTCSAGACSCPLTTCGSSCVDTTSDPKNCGACGNACVSCSSSACQCVPPGNTNLLTNGGFDSNVAGWTTFDSGIVLSHATLDASDCSTSGSVLASNQAPNGLNSGFLQCVPVTAGQSYDVGAWIRTPSGGAHGQTFLQLAWFTGTGCTGTLSLPSANLLSASGAFDTWELLSLDNAVAPAGTLSAYVYGQIIKNFTDTLPYQTYYDRMYLSPSPGHF